MFEIEASIESIASTQLTREEAGRRLGSLRLIADKGSESQRRDVSRFTLEKVLVHEDRLEMFLRAAALIYIHVMETNEKKFVPVERWLAKP